MDRIELAQLYGEHLNINSQDFTHQIEFKDLITVVEKTTNESLYMYLMSYAGTHTLMKYEALEAKKTNGQLSAILTYSLFGLNIIENEKVVGCMAYYHIPPHYPYFNDREEFIRNPEIAKLRFEALTEHTHFDNLVVSNIYILAGGLCDNVKFIENKDVEFSIYNFDARVTETFFNKLQLKEQI